LGEGKEQKEKAGEENKKAWLPKRDGQGLGGY
jgi:hypothetical protein